LKFASEYPHTREDVGAQPPPTAGTRHLGCNWLPHSSCWCGAFTHPTPFLPSGLGIRTLLLPQGLGVSALPPGAETPLAPATASTGQDTHN